MTLRAYDVEWSRDGGTGITTVDADDSEGARAAMALVPGALRVLASRPAGQPLPATTTTGRRKR